MNGNCIIKPKVYDYNRIETFKWLNKTKRYEIIMMLFILWFFFMKSHTTIKMPLSRVRTTKPPTGMNANELLFLEERHQKFTVFCEASFIFYGGTLVIFVVLLTNRPILLSTSKTLSQPRLMLFLFAFPLHKYVYVKSFQYICQQRQINVKIMCREEIFACKFRALDVHITQPSYRISPL